MEILKKIIGSQANISNHSLVLGASYFFKAIFLGRISWGFIVDYIGSSMGIFLTLPVQSVAIISLNVIPLSNTSSIMIGFIIRFAKSLCYRKTFSQIPQRDSILKPYTVTEININFLL